MYVCLIGDDGRKLIPGRTAAGREHADVSRPALRNHARQQLRDDVRRRDAADRAAVQPGDRLLDHEGRRAPAAGGRASCRRARERSARAGDRRDGHRGADRPGQRPQRAVAGRAAARARAWTSRTRRSSATARRTCAAALRFMAGQGIELVLTSGGLGPTADDLTAEVVGRFQGREMVLDEALAERIAEIVRPLLKRWPNIDAEAIARGQPQAGDDPRGRDGARAGGHRAGARRARRRRTGRARADGRGAPGPAARAAADVGAGARRREALRAALAGATVVPSSARCACSGSPSRRSPRRCAWPSARGWSSSTWRSRPA